MTLVMNHDHVNAVQALRNQLRGRSDADIQTSIAATRGIDAVLDDVFDGIAHAFLPGRAGRAAAVLQYDVATAHGVRTYQLHVADGRCEARRGTPFYASTTFAVTFPDLLRLVCGELGGARAFLTGRLRARGDLRLVPAMRDWFDAPA